MTRPTDDELEEMAMRLDCYSHDWRLRHMDVDPLTDAAAMLRALSAALETEKRHKLAITGDKINAVSELRQVKAERDALKAELSEAKMLLSHMVNHAEWRETNEGVFWEATDKARAFLARHQKETDT